MKRKTPRQYSLIKFNYDSFDKKWHKLYLKTFKKNDTLCFFGEIPNMPGHCIVSNIKTGKFYFGYHTENFIELTEDET